MALTRIPYRNTGYFSSLICDLIEGHPDLEALVSGPVNLAEFEKQISVKQKHYSLSTREALVKALRAQYQGLSSTKKLEAQLTLLAEETTFTITTGHQLNLFTGPLYFFIKLFRRLICVNSLSKSTHSLILFPFIGWRLKIMILKKSLFFFQGKKLQWNEQSQGPVGRLPLASLTPLLDVFEKSIGESDHAKEIKAIVQSTYRTATNLAEATQKLVHHFLGKKD